MNERAAIFGITSNPALANELATGLDLPLGKMEVITFADSEKRVRIEEDIRDKNVAVIASLSNPVDSYLVELCLVVDALKSNDAHKIIAVIPYYGYARQDKAHRDGEGVSARVMARLIEAVDISRVIAIDLHSDAVAGFFKVPVTHLSGAPIFVERLLQEPDDYVVVAPDAGAAKRAQHFASLMGAPMVMIEKKRNLDKLHTIDSIHLIGEVKGKTAIIVDDVVTSGSTLVKAAYALEEAGAKKVIACVTHADFVAGTHTILGDSPIPRVLVSDSIAKPEEYKFDKLEILPLANLLIPAIRKVI